MSTLTVYAHERVSTDRAVEATGATRRQLEYWVRCGYLHPDNALRGSGVPFLRPSSEVAVAKRIIQLLRLGFHLQAAISMARRPGEMDRAARDLLEMAEAAS